MAITIRKAAGVANESIEQGTGSNVYKTTKDNELCILSLLRSEIQ